MCGIGGIVRHATDMIDVAGLRRMGGAMAERGPDDEGVHVAAGVGLIHRRLSILDLSALGNCPMPNEDGTIQILLNGEIYNWRELRAQLLAQGHTFRSNTDSEVIAHGYEAWGESVFERLRGMFAIAIWDQPRRRLLLARDRAGEKPLFFVHAHGELRFASSARALLAYDERPLPLDADALVCYLAHSFIPATHTAWQGIRVLPPAHYAVLDDASALQLRRYWRFPPQRPGAISAARAERDVEAVLADSVQRCLDADVPVGVFLSGGVDSSLIAALAARHRPGLCAFSLGFREQDFSELPYARKVAAHLGLPHHVVEVGANEVIGCLPHLVRQYGQPFGDASAVPSYLLARLARRHVKVCLSGDGGDESFAGYWRAQAGVYAHRYAQVMPRIVRARVVPFVAPRLGRPGARWTALNAASLAAPGAGYSNAQSWHGMLGELAGPRLRGGLAHDRVACRLGQPCDSAQMSALQRLLHEDFQVQLADAYLTKVDVASMAASLEVRAPFLDQHVIEQAWLLPDRLKLHWGTRKWLLKRIAARLVPPEVVYRPKMGFAMPLVHWWRGALGDFLERLLGASVAQAHECIRTEPVYRLLREHRDGADHHTRLWLVLWLELWFRLVVSQVPADELVAA